MRVRDLSIIKQIKNGLKILFFFEIFDYFICPRKDDITFVKLEFLRKKTLLSNLPFPINETDLKLKIRPKNRPKFYLKTDLKQTLQQSSYRRP